MKCTVCSTDLSPSSQFCRGCGMKLSPLLRQFVTVEARNVELLKQVRNGEIDQPAFQAARSKLVIQDPSGGSWFPGDDLGTWLAWDSKGWHPADPSPVLKSVASAETPVPSQGTGSRETPPELPVSPATQMIDEADIPRITAPQPAKPATAAALPQQPAGSSTASPPTQMIDEEDLEGAAASIRRAKPSPSTIQPRSKSSLTQPPNLYLLIFAGFLVTILTILVLWIVLGGDEDSAGSGVPYPAATSELTITPTETQPPLTQETPPGTGDIEDELPLPTLPTVDLPGLPPHPPVSSP